MAVKQALEEVECSYMLLLCEIYDLYDENSEPKLRLPASLQKLSTTRNQGSKRAIKACGVQQGLLFR